MVKRVKPSGCWNKIILSIPLKHPHEVKRLLSWGDKKIDFEKIIPIPRYISRSNNNVETSYFHNGKWRQNNNSWNHFRNKNWGCTWNPDNTKVKQSINGEEVKTKFWTTDVPIGILFKLKFQCPELVFGGHSKTYIKDEYQETDKGSWKFYEWDILNQHTSDEIGEIWEEMTQFFSENNIHDLSILFDKRKPEEQQIQSHTLEKFFI